MSNLPFKAYEGDEQYIFISYAHKNSEKVFPVIKQLYEMGYRIWYDEGIDPGSEWPESIAEHLSKATAVMLFVTPESMASDNVRREITFALNLRKIMLSIYLVPTVISDGMQLQLGLNQAIHYYTYKTDEVFFGKLLKIVPEATKEARFIAAETPRKDTPKPERGLFGKFFGTPQPVEIETPVIAETNAAPDENKEQDISFNSSIVMPFMPTGTATIKMIDGTTLEAPLNTMIVLRDNGNFAGMSFYNKTTEANYIYGADENFFAFQDMKSFEVTFSENRECRLEVVMYMTDGTRNYCEDYFDFKLGMLVGNGYRSIAMSEISSVEFDREKHLQEPVSMALITTSDDVSFYTPFGMLSWIETYTSSGVPFSQRSNKITMSGCDIELRRFKSMRLIEEQPEQERCTTMKLSFELKSGMTDELKTTMYYLPRLVGVNQYGCFMLSIKQISRIDVFGVENESAPMPTPLPYIKWPELKNEKAKFYGEGRAEVITKWGEKYECPANSIYALNVGYYGGLIPYSKINTTVKGDRMELFTICTDDALTSIFDISSLTIMDEASRFNYNAEVTDVSGTRYSGLLSLINQNIYPAFVYPKRGKQGFIRVIDLKEIRMDHDADAPKVEISSIFTKDGQVTTVPRCGVIFFAYSNLSANCFRLPTGNFIETNRLKRIMVADSKTSETETQQWIVFECDGFAGAFPLKDPDSFKICTMSPLGLRTMQPGNDWVVIEMD